MSDDIRSPILLVDDEAGIRTVLGITLADSGYEVTTAENGEEALRLFREIRPAIVLTDIKMPDMDGIELLQHIKAESAGHRGHHVHRPRRHGAGHQEPQARCHRLRHQADQRRYPGDRPQAGARANRHAAATARVHARARAARGGEGAPPGRGRAHGRGRADRGRTGPHHQEHRQRLEGQHLRAGQGHRARRAGVPPGRLADGREQRREDQGPVAGPAALREVRPALPADAATRRTGGGSRCA